MRKREEEFIRAAMQITELFYRGKSFILSGFYTDNVECIAPGFYGRGKRLEGYLEMLQKKKYRITHKRYHLVQYTEQFAVAMGHCSLVKEEREGKEQSEDVDITIMLTLTEGRIGLKYIHISEAGSPERFWIKDIRERVYQLREKDILYLEALHNHVVWHCREYVVETVKLLKDVEETLNENFVRIHRSYIVNRQHVRKVDRCYVELDNGDILQIPVKKYCEVKKQLQGPAQCTKDSIRAPLQHKAK